VLASYYNYYIIRLAFWKASVLHFNKLLEEFRNTKCDFRAGTATSWKFNGATPHPWLGTPAGVGNYYPGRRDAEFLSACASKLWFFFPPPTSQPNESIIFLISYYRVPLLNLLLPTVYLHMSSYSEVVSRFVGTSERGVWELLSMRISCLTLLNRKKNMLILLKWLNVVIIRGLFVEAPRRLYKLVLRESSYPYI